MRRLLRLLAYFAGFIVGARAAATPSDSPIQAGSGAPASAARGPASQHRDQESSHGKSHWKSRLLKAVALLIVLAVGGFVVSASGVIPIKASSGHWPITEWFLHFSMKRSISTHTLGMSAPPLDDPALILKGAGHFHSGCFPCHGNPELPHPRVAAAMTPHPPYLPPRIPEWEDEELFYIVKHGVKFTGMPAWPSLERDDEVWAMVAFLRQLPELDAQEYRTLVHGEVGETGDSTPLEELTGPRSAEIRRIVTESCGRCHGTTGKGRGTGAFPKLAGQRAPYLLASLQAYARGERHSGIMEPVAAGLHPEVMQLLAEYYSEFDSEDAVEVSDADAEAIERGRRIAHQGMPRQRIPVCADCHGSNEVRTNPIYPQLAGQYADYLVQQLELFKTGKRGGTNHAHIMQSVAEHLTSEQMRNVALYYQSLAVPDVPRGDDARPLQ